MASKRKAQRPAERPSKAFEAEIAARLRERARLLLAGETQVLAALAAARAQILATLAGLPSDWQQWQLSRLLGQLEEVLQGATGTAGALFELRMQDAWRLGEDFIEKPLALIGHPVELRLAQLDVGVLKQMRAFGALRLKDVGAEAARKIGSQLGLVTIGAQTPFEAVQTVQKVLGSDSPQRAVSIVRTEVSRAFAVAAEERMEQAAALVPGLGKQWRRSGKIHSRWNHDLMDGQVVDAGKPFKVPDPAGGFDMMLHPHDPAAPVGQIINCGCVAIPWLAGWKVSTPGAKPYSERELRLDKRKADLDQAAKRAGRRNEGPAR